VKLMGRQILRGVLGGLAALATLYALGSAGLFVEWITRQPAFDGAFTFVGLLLSLGIGVLVLHRLSRSAERRQLPNQPADAVGSAAPEAEPGHGAG
jgi:hypothetical protein